MGTAKGSGASSAVGHQRGAAPRAAGAPKVLVQGQGIAVFEAFGVLSEASGQGERGRAHAVGDHEDKIALPFRLPSRLVGVGLLSVRNPYGEDQDACRCDKCPNEEDDLTQPR